MIDSITLTNFQIHKDLFLDLDPGVNVIVGSSDSGKSSIIRAFRLVSENRPAGIKFITKNQKECQVIIKKGSDIITRIRSVKDNVYKLNDQEYAGFNSDVPEEITKALNFGEINTQYQMDSAFLLSDSAGEISRYLNKVANLSVMDTSLKNLASTKRKISQDIRYAETEVEELEKQIKDFPDLGIIERLISNAEKLQKQIEEDKLKYNALAKIVKSYSEVEENSCDTTELANEAALCDKGAFIYSEYQKLIKKQTELKSCMGNIEKRKYILKCQNVKLNELVEKYDKLMPEICPLCGK